MVIKVVSAVLMLGVTTALAQTAGVREQVRAWRAQHEAEIVREYAGLLAIPNLARDTENIRRNAEHIVAMMERRGIAASLLEGGGGPPIVFGQLGAPGATRTIVIYAHYDGQPVDPAKWQSDPWKPVLRDPQGNQIMVEQLSTPIAPESRLYARSASDDKAPIQAVLSALDAVKAAGIPLSVNLKFFFEGEEEAGSPHLESVLHVHGELLQADAWLLCDGPVHQSRRMQVYFGARGVQDLEITVYGPTRGLHSGHYGGWAPNPAVRLAELLTSMRNSKGEITIEGFYEPVARLTGSEQKALEELIAAHPRNLAGDFGFALSEKDPLPSVITDPTLNVRGIRSGAVADEAANAIPTEARLSIDFRLVPNLTPAMLKQLVETHVRKQDFHIISGSEPTPAERRRHAKIARLEWGPGYPAARTSMDLPFSRALVQAVNAGGARPALRVPTLGGSVPMYLFQQVARVPVVGLPIVNHDNNQHSHDENLRIQNLWDGIETFAAILTRLGPEWEKARN